MLATGVVASADLTLHRAPRKKEARVRTSLLEEMQRGTPTSTSPGESHRAPGCLLQLSNPCRRQKLRPKPTGAGCQASRLGSAGGALSSPGLQQVSYHLPRQIFLFQQSIFHLRQPRHLTPTLKSVNCDFAHGDHAQPARRSSAGLPVPTARSRVFLRSFSPRPLGR